MFGHFDLYGNSYRTAQEAYNAEMAQCAQIDADILYREVESLKRQASYQAETTPIEYELHELRQQISELNRRVEILESKQSVY